jgi:group I intron endonuclease
MTASVYSITHRETGRQYFGITSRRPEKRWSEHKKNRRSRNTHIACALRKYGPEAFDFKVEFETADFETAKLAEKELIAEFKPAFNLTVGGDGVIGYVFTDEARAKMRAAGLGRRQPPEARAKISVAMSKRVVSAETRAKMSASQRGRNVSAETRAKIAASVSKCTGWKHSEETKAKMRQAQTGRKHTDAARQNMSKSKTGRLPSAVARVNMSEAQRRRRERERSGA